jgi:predicted ATPase with chaperone activity
MHKKEFCAKKLTEIGPNLEAKAMYFSKIQITLSRNPEKCPPKAAIAKPKKIYFLLLKHAPFILTSHNITHKHV